MTSRTLIMAACVAALTAGCQAKKVTNAKAERAEATEEEKKQETVSDYTPEATDEVAENAAEATRKAADDTLRETERAEETVLGENETLPPEPGVDMPAETGEEMDPVSGKEPGDIVAEKPEVDFGTQVTAKVEKVDQKQSHVVFTVSEGKDEIALQSGKEIKVPFGDLRLLTGMEKDKAIEALQSAGELKVRVLGVGEAMRIVEIDLPEADEKEPVKGMEEKTY